MLLTFYPILFVLVLLTIMSQLFFPQTSLSSVSAMFNMSFYEDDNPKMFSESNTDSDLDLNRKFKQIENELSENLKQLEHLTIKENELSQKANKTVEDFNVLKAIITQKETLHTTIIKLSKDKLTLM